MTVLPLRVRNENKEPAPSLEHRLAARWSMTVTSFRKRIGLKDTGWRSIAELERLASLSGRDFETLHASTPMRANRARRVSIGSAWTDLSDWSGRVRRYCPTCMAQDRSVARDTGSPVKLAAWSRPQWSVKSIKSCVLHECLLISSCPECGHDAGIEDPKLDQCRCGRRLWNCAAPPSKSLSDRLLQSLIEGRGEHPNFLGAGLSQISRHLLRIAAMGQGWRAERPIMDNRGGDPRDSGLAMLLGGNTKIQQLFDQILSDARPGPSGKIGLMAGYGWVWKSWLGVPSSDPLDAQLRDRLLHHARSAGIIGSKGDSSVSLGTACKMLGTGHERGRRIVVNAELVAGTPLQGVPMSVDAKRVESLAGKLAGLIDAQAAAAYFGIGRARFREMQLLGMVTPEATLEKVGAGRFYDPVKLKAFADKIAGNAKLISTAPSDCLPLHQACRFTSMPITGVISAILDNKLLPSARTKGPPLACLWFQKDCLRRSIRPRRLTVRIAAKALDLHYEAARALTSMGELGSRPGFVDEAGVTRFKRMYITANQAGAAVGASGRFASALLISLDVAPVFSPPMCRQRIWSRQVAMVGMKTAQRP